jgi:hypothetical protein
MQRARIFAMMLAAAPFLASCEKPAPDPAGIEAAGIELPALPSAPAWAPSYLGKSAASLFPSKGKEKCYGSIDNVAQSDDPANPVAKFSGWAWDDKHSAPFDMVLAVNADEIVVGAGDVALERPDVMKAATDRVTEPKVGFDVFASQKNGPVTLFGVQKKFGLRCEIGTEYTF